MAENLYIPVTEDKEEKYIAIIPQIESLINGEGDLIANLANITAVLREVFGFFWVGFYIAKGEDLILGPFQGPLACTRIKYGRGVCGTAWKAEETIIVNDVEKFPGHIACSSLSKSEIVVPVFSRSKVAGVLDVDSDKLNSFDNIDKEYLEKICKIISIKHFQ